MFLSNFNQVNIANIRNMTMGAGIFAKTFDPEHPETPVTPIAATTGGATFTATPNLIHYGSGIDNLHDYIKELTDIDYWTANMSGTAKSVDAAAVKRRLGAADIDANDGTLITPRNTITAADFDTCWWLGAVGKLPDVEGDNHFIAICIENALSTGGFSLKSNDKGTGDYAFQYTPFYSLSHLDEVPFKIYCASITA